MAHRASPPPPPSRGLQFSFTFCLFPLMNAGLILGPVKEEAADLNEVAAGFQYSSHKEPFFVCEGKTHYDYHNEANRRPQAGTAGAQATLLILVPESGFHLLLI